MYPVIQSDNSSEDPSNDLIIEKNSLRRFLVGVTATTFGVLVALHPNTFASKMCCWLYVISVISNALSLVFFIGSLFGRYRNLKEKCTNQNKRFEAAMQGINFFQAQPKFPGIFRFCSILGLFFYIIAIITSCIFITMEILG